MRILIQLMIALCFVTQLNAQQKTLNTKSETSTAGFMKFEQHITALQLANDKSTLQLGTNDNLEIISVTQDNIGFTHHRYQQTYKGIPIEGAEYIMHEKDSRVTHANGRLARNINLTTTPSITEAQALQYALNYMNGHVYAWESNKEEAILKQQKNQEDATYYPSGELVIIDLNHKLNTENCILVYKFDIYSLEPLNRKNIYVDAHSGIVLWATNKIQSCTHTPVTATTEHYGDVEFNACYEGMIYSLRNENLGNQFAVFNDNNTGEGLNNPVVSINDTFNSDPVANEVFWAMEKTHDYFSANHGLDNLYHMPIYARVHYDNNPRSAWWSNGQIYIPDGDNENFKAFSSMEITGHELTHGVIENGSDLEYEGESGALNESFADIFGELVEHYYHPIASDWIIGGDIIIQEFRDGIRNMADPNDEEMTTMQPDTYLGDSWLDDSAPTGTLVHTNSGVQNYWFYLLAEGGSGVNDNGYPYDIQGIGIEKAAQVAYHNMMFYLTRYDGYAEARVGAIEAAEELQAYGILAASDVQQVKDAWCAVGVGDCIPVNCVERDYAALVAIYNSTGGSDWINTWDTLAPIDTWYGVTVDSGCVTGLNLSGNNLTGNLPTELRNLTRLNSLDLSDNSLTSISNGFSNFANLEFLDLSNNDFSGTISDEFGYLPNLEFLDLSSCSFEGSIPASIANLDNLTTLDVSNNNLSGNIPIELAGMSSLNSFYVYDNQFTFIIESFNSVASITDYQYAPQDSLTTHFLVDRLYVDADGSNINNTYTWYLNDMPISMANDSFLVDITVNPGWYRCEISNSIVTNADDTTTNLILSSKAIYVDAFSPRVRDSLALVAFYHATDGPNWSIGFSWDLTDNMDNWEGVTMEYGQPYVKILDITGLAIEGINGSIPPEIGNLRNLESLVIRNIPGLTGSIPAEISNMESLQNLIIADCNLTGEIPAEIGNMTGLNALALTGNNLTGSIPPELGNLVNLTALALGQNNLSGDIPPELGNLTLIFDLLYGLFGGMELNDNNLTGSIPAGLCNTNSYAFVTPTAQGNNLTFDIGENCPNLHQSNWIYAPQDSIPTHIAGTKLYVYAGGNISDNTYTWFRDGTMLGETTDSLDITDVGTYYCRITNSTLPDLTLWSKEIAFDSPVLPGDANRDCVVDEHDLSYWNDARDNMGPERSGATTNWEPQIAPLWNSEVLFINGKHQDCNGDGAVDGLDRQVIIDNWGSIYSEPKASSGIVNSYQFRLEFVSDNVIGDILETKYAIYLEEMPELKSISFKLDLTNHPAQEIYNVDMDLTNSVFASGQNLDTLVMPTDDYRLNTVFIGVTDYITIDGSLGTAVVQTKNLAGGDDEPSVITITKGSAFSTNGKEDVSDMTLYTSTTAVGSDISLKLNLSTTPAFCNQPGTASVCVIETVDSCVNDDTYTYQWCNGETSPQTDLFPGDTCSVMVMDSLGRSGMITFSIEGIIPIVANLTIDGNEVTAMPSGGTPPYTYEWNGVEGTNTMTLDDGSHLLQITDATGCQLNELVVICGSGAITADISIDDNVVTVTPSGGTPPYTYHWNGMLGDSIMTLDGGTHVVQITDATGCQYTEEIIIVSTDSPYPEPVQLGQNIPNPASNITTIHYNIPAKINNAELVIFNINGQQVKHYPIATGEGSVNVNLNNLADGMYMYALMSNGQMIASKRMIVTK